MLDDTLFGGGISGNLSDWAEEGDADVKAVLVVMILVVFTGTRGTRALSIPAATSAAFRQCQNGCDPLNIRLAADVDGLGRTDSEFAAWESTIADIAGPNRECFLCGTERYEEQRPSFGGVLPQPRPAVFASVFDPAD